ncbi:MAG: Xaa-Pro peptidase family protein, partial [Proteobacteria bacterium]|nr:Xaa-Pro peptidase family protein [Pseudomonadota bacterium]
LTLRVKALQEALAPAGIGLALIRQPADLFYYAGTLVDGFLAVAPEGQPSLLVRRPHHQDHSTPGPWPRVLYRDLKELPQILGQAGLEPRGAVALELDVIPAALFRRIQEQLFPGQSIIDLSPLIRIQRMVKSAYELTQLQRAAAILDQVHAEVPALLKPGMSELELSAALEYRLRLLGHQGLVRLRNWELELYYGHVLSGVSGLLAAYTDTPSGGPGFSAAFPQGPSLKKLAPNEPISIDLAACVNGYVVDMTRMYALGSLPSQVWETWEAVEELYRLFTATAKPGTSPGEIFHLLWDAVRTRGLANFFMGLGADRVSFLAHGVGLELDEYPLITSRFPYPLEADMVLAFEPKFFLPAIGMIGQEDTGRITPAGVEWLTHSPRGITIV